MTGAQHRRHQLIAELRKLEKPGWRKEFSDEAEQAVQRGWRYAAWAAKRNLDLPAPGSPEDDAFGNLVAVAKAPGGLQDELTRYVARKLDKLGPQDSALRVEREIGKEVWKRVFENADREVGASYIRNRLSDWELWPDILPPFLTAHFPTVKSLRGELHGEVKGIFEDLADQFPRRANPTELNWERQHWSFLPLLAHVAASRTDSHQLWRYWLSRFFRNRWRNLKGPPRALGDLACVVFGADEYRELLALASADDLVDVHEWNSDLFQRLADFAPGGIAEILAGWWDQRSFEETEWTWSKMNEWERARQLEKLLPPLDSRALERLALQLGLTIGLILAKLSSFPPVSG